MTSRGQSLGALNKDDKSPVTIADFAVQALIIHALSREFPGDRFIAEENSELLLQDNVRAIMLFTRSHLCTPHMGFKANITCCLGLATTQTQVYNYFCTVMKLACLQSHILPTVTGYQVGGSRSAARCQWFCLDRENVDRYNR